MKDRETTPDTTATDIALLSQFNTEVVKPFIAETRQTQQEILTELKNMNYVTHNELDDARKAVAERFKQVDNEIDKRITRREATIAGTTVTIFLSVLAFIFDKVGGS